MPRKANPAAGANRSDLLAPQPSPQLPGQPNGRPEQPNVQPTGLPYGQAGQMHADQGAAPVPNLTGPPLAQALSEAKSFPSPDQSGLTPLSAPTERPDEHVMTGALPPHGMGPPAPGLQQGAAPQQSAMADMLDQMASASGSAKLQELARQARQGN